MKKLVLSILFLYLLNFNVSARDQLVLQSDNINKLDTVWTFTPSNYDENSIQDYPIIFLLHGWSGNYMQWNDIMDCQSYADKFGFIIVCPDGLYNSWYINSPAIEGSQYASFFFNELVPEIFKKYRINDNKVFITGLSMGGHGSLYLFSKKPELFKSAGSISGVVDLSFCPDDYEIRNYLGLKNDEKDQKKLDEFSVIGNIEKIAEAKKKIIFSCGTEDPFYKLNNELRKKCDELKIKATYISDPGGHNYDYWNTAIKYHFHFFSQMIR